MTAPGSVFAPGLFEGTAAYYARHRPSYPPEVLDLLIGRFALSPHTHVFDLGCGTGQIAIPLAQRGIPVCAVDPDTDMLAEGRRAEADAGGLGIRWQIGNDRSLHTLRLPPLTLCTMGASFHWMDRDAVLRDLDALILSGGGIAVLSAGRDAAAQANAWSSICIDVVAEFLGSARRAGGGTYDHPAENHMTVLLRSPFSAIESLSFTRATTIGIDDIIGLQLSMSFSSPAQLGDRLDAFRSTLRERLSSAEPSGQFKWMVVTELLIARRPTETSRP